jgi:hypothetical protein
VTDPRIGLARPGCDRRHGPAGEIVVVPESANVWTNGMTMIGADDFTVVLEITIIRFTTFAWIVVLLLIPG